MMKRAAEALFISLFLLLIVTFGVWVSVKEPTDLSLSERRSLAKMPEMSVQTIRSGEFFEAFEDYLLDQFPGREQFRRLRAITTYYILNKKDNHGIVIENGYAARLETALSNDAEADYIAAVATLSERLFGGKSCHIYQTVIPDKMQYITEGGYPSVSYASFFEKLEDANAATFIDISDTLDIRSYYKTDTHWTQEKLFDTADRLLREMGGAFPSNCGICAEYSPFYGVYYGQAALPLSPDVIYTVSTEAIEAAHVQRLEPSTGAFTEGDVYMDDPALKDRYDIFLGGGAPVIKIDNTLKDEGKTLYLLSDSFGRSLAPLLLSEYDEVVFIDTRYISPTLLLQKLTVKENSDVLFAFSPLSIRQGITYGS